MTTRYFAEIYSTNSELFTKTGTMAEITTWIHGFLLIEISTVNIGKIVGSLA